MTQKTYSVTGLVWACLWLLGVLFVELVVSVPLCALVVFWRMAMALRIEQQVMVASVMAMIITTSYSLSMSLVLGLLLVGLGSTTVLSKLNQESSGKVLIVTLVIGLILGYSAGVHPTTAVLGGVVFSAIGMAYLFGVLRLPRWRPRGVWS